MNSFDLQGFTDGRHDEPTRGLGHRACDSERGQHPDRRCVVVETAAHRCGGTPPHSRLKRPASLVAVMPGTPLRKRVIGHLPHATGR